MKKAQFEKQLTEKNEIIKELRMQLEKKQEEYAHLQDVWLHVHFQSRL